MTNQDRKVLLVGRDPADIATIYNFGGPITDSPVSSTRDDAGVWTGGNIRQWVDELTTAVIDHHTSPDSSTARPKSNTPTRLSDAGRKRSPRQCARPSGTTDAMRVVVTPDVHDRRLLLAPRRGRARVTTHLGRGHHPISTMDRRKTFN